MRRPPFTPALVAGAFLLALSACNDDTTSASSGGESPNVDHASSSGSSGSVRGALVAANPEIVGEFSNPVTGETVKVFNGGYGSAIATDPWRRNVYYLMTDRGPNFDFNGGIAFPLPDFDPQIGVFRRVGGKLVRGDVIGLKDRSCRPLTGLPLPSGATGSTGEVAYRVDGSVLDPDPNGIDSEGLVALRDGSFWVSDEYGPFLVHFNHRGCTIERVGPASSGRALPLVLAARRPNRGMEGLTEIFGGRVLVGIMQSPLDNPSAAGRASRLARLVVFDTKTGKSEQFAYLLEASNLTNSEIVALSPRRFVVLERDGDFPGSNPAAIKRLYQIDLSGATDISDPANGPKGLLVNGKTLEELTASAADPAAVLRAAGIKPVSKKLAVDIVAALPGYPHDKVEGITLVDWKTVAVSNDDDFGVTNGAGGLIQKVIPGTTPPRPDFNEVVFVKLP